MCISCGLGFADCIYDGVACVVAVCCCGWYVPRVALALPPVSIVLQCVLQCVAECVAV